MRLLLVTQQELMFLTNYVNINVLSIIIDFTFGRIFYTAFLLKRILAMLKKPLFKNLIILLFALVFYNFVGVLYAQNNQGRNVTLPTQTGFSTLPELNKNSNLDDYVKYALLNSPGLKASFEKWQAALEKVPQVKTLPDPVLSYSNYIEEVETRVGPQKHAIGLNQKFPWFGKLNLKGQVAMQGANAQKEQYEVKKLMLISQVKKLYHSYSYIAQAIKITKDNITLVNNFESVARTKYKGGVGLQNAVIKIQVELGKLEDRLITLKDSLRPVVSKLNSAMNRPIELTLPLPPNISEEKVYLKKEELISMLKRMNPNLKALDFMIEKEDFSVSLAKKNYYPDVTLGVNYISTDSRFDATPPDNGKDPLIAKFSINIPLWRKKYDAQVRENKSKYNSAVQNRQALENSLIADLEMALYELRDADRKIGLYRNTLLPKAEQNVKVNQLAFSADKASFLDLIDAQRVLLQFQLSEKKAMADYAKALAEIEKLTGLNYERKIK